MIDTGKYKIKFEYFNWAGEKPDELNPPVTCICNVYDKDGNLIVIGSSYKENQFTKSIQRKLALLDALNNLGLSRKEKQSVFLEYRLSWAK